MTIWTVDSMNMVDSIDMGNMQKLSFLKVASRPFRMIQVDMEVIVDKMAIVDKSLAIYSSFAAYEGSCLLN